MTTASYNDTNPFAIRFRGSDGRTSFILAHQPKSFDWRARRARPHPLKKVPQDAYEQACQILNQIIELQA